MRWMRQIALPGVLVLSLLPILCSCSSTEGAKKEETRTRAEQEENPAIREAREEWKKFAAEREAEEQRRHNMTSMQNDSMKVFPWRGSSGRRSETLQEQSDSSVFKLW